MFNYLGDIRSAVIECRMGITLKFKNFKNQTVWSAGRLQRALLHELLGRATYHVALDREVQEKRFCQIELLVNLCSQEHSM